MTKILKFNSFYFLLFLTLFLIEIYIAKYNTGFIRHTIGDYLVVILLYTFIKSFLKLSVEKTALFVLLIAYLIEFLQLSHLQHIYPEKYEKTLKLILGTSFSIGDLLAYTLGIITIIILEKVVRKLKA